MSNKKTVVIKNPDPEKYDGSTPLAKIKHETLARELVLGEHRGNRTRAYQAVFGCSPESARVNATRLLGGDDVNACLIQRRIAYLQQYAVLSDVNEFRLRVLDELAALAFARPMEYITEEGRVDIAALKAASPGWIKELIVTETPEGRRVHFKTHDKRGPLADLYALANPQPEGPAPIQIIFDDPDEALI